ncbi:MAG: hypothetical protein ABSE73_11915 [Planctomycetota bacterium]
MTLKTFNQASVAPSGVSAAEDYWRLIGKTGEVVAGFGAEPHLRKRVLVKFHEDLARSGLIAHNEVPNALWILVADLDLRPS